MRKGWIRNIVIVVWATIVACLPMRAYAADEVALSKPLFRLYSKAIKNVTNDQGLVYADSLREASIAEGSKIGELLALAVPVVKAYNCRDGLEVLENKMKPLQEKALQYKEPMYYYFAVSNKVYYLSRENKYQSAVQYMRQELDFARKSSHPYGIYAGYNLLGHMHHRRGEYLLAIADYKRAIDFGRQKLPQLGMESAYRQICVCYRHSQRFDDLIEFVDESLASGVSEECMNTLEVNKCYSLFMLGRDREFIDLYDEVKTYKHKNLRQLTQICTALDAYKHLVDGKADEALKLIEGMNDNRDRTLTMSAYYQRTCQYLEEIECLQGLYAKDMSRNTVSISVDMADLDAVYEHHKIMLDKERDDYRRSQLELANAQLQLSNTRLEIGSQNNAKQLSESEANRNLLTYNNQKLETDKLISSIETQRYIREEKERNMRMHKIVLIVALVCGLLVALLVFVLMHRSVKMSRRLKESNVKFHKMLEEIRVAKDAAMDANERKTKFLRNMSHEIRTPLNSIVGFSQVLVDMGADLDKDEKRDVMKRISANSELLSALVNDILDLTSIESGRYVMKEEDVAVNNVCQMAVDQVMHRKPEGVDLRFTTDAPDDFAVTSDAQRVMCVLVNMLTNAEKNTAAGEIVLDCSLEKTPGMVTFTVTDTGVGIAVDDMDGIFERFTKLDTFKQGTGLGLYICRVIAEKLGGEIDVDREYSGGARFWFKIPANRK